MKPKLVPYANLRNLEEVVISPEKRQEILNELRQVYLKYLNILKYLNY